MSLLFSFTLFCSAFLLFQIQPMVGKMLTPKLGGTPAVWNTCMVFFQAMLLAGYAYSHAMTKLLGSRRQSVLHLFVLLLPLAALPVVIHDDAFRLDATSENPILLVLKQLAVAVGLPFFVTATTAPLIQRWFSDTGHAAAKDPYFLYAASNLGSMLGLIAYPSLVEPRLTLNGQSRWWAWGYGLCAVLVGLCATTLWTRRKPTNPTPAPDAAGEALDWKRRAWWVVVAFVPSSMLLGCTTYISTDIAPIPLLWIVPLMLYLLSFILVFSKHPPLPHPLMCRLLPIAVVVLSLVLLTGATDLKGLPVWVLLGFHLCAFFLVAMVGHGELARNRPGVVQLTEFFLWMSVGGVLGGMFNALIAPVIFRNTGLMEYPLVIVLACLLRPMNRGQSLVDVKANSKHLPPPRANEAVGVSVLRGLNAWDIILPIFVGLLVISANLLTQRFGFSASTVRTALAFGVPCVLVYTFVARVPRFALGIAALFLAGGVKPEEERLLLNRNFFGVIKIADISVPEGSRFRALFHGNTIHGQMSLDKVGDDGRREPLTYYHRTGPIGVVCRTWFAQRPEGQRIAAIGLGTGSLAYYARPGDRWLFYEIDPAIQRIAENPAYFTFMSECRAGQPTVILGDGYLRLREAPEGSFDFLILDAFSSDSIPVHLMTREAISLYRRRLKSGGIMAFHISNRYLNLQPILAKLAEDAGLVARGWHDLTGDMTTGKFDSDWVIMAEREEDFGKVVWPRGRNSFPDPRWETIYASPDTPVWTNNFSNLLSAFGQRGEE